MKKQFIKLDKIVQSSEIENLDLNDTNLYLEKIADELIKQVTQAATWNHDVKTSFKYLTNGDVLITSRGYYNDI